MEVGNIPSIFFFFLSSGRQEQGYTLEASSGTKTHDLVMLEAEWGVSGNVETRI